MAILEAYALDGVTVGTTELSIVSGTTTLQEITTAGAYQLWVDASLMQKGDQFLIRIYERVLAGSPGTDKLVVFDPLLSNVNTKPLVTPVLFLLNGWDMTIQKIAGTDRAFSSSIRKA
jgi:hypothetical protein